MDRCTIDHIATLVGALFVVTPAVADVSRDRMVCSGEVPAAQPDQRVAACTAVIDAGGETPTNLAVAYCARGVAYQARDHLDRAIADYNESVRIAPMSAASYRCRGFGNLARGAVDDAITDFNEAIALDPGAASSFLSRGPAYRAKGDLSRAIADYEEAIRLDPKNAAAYTNRGIAYTAQGESARAKADFDHAKSVTGR